MAPVIFGLLLTTASIWTASGKTFLDLQFDVKLIKSPKECRKQDHRGRCVISYAISLLESFADFDLQAIMLQEGHVAQVSSDRRKHFKEDTIVAVPASYSASRESHLFVGVKFYGLSSSVQDYFVVDATKLLRHPSSTKAVATFDRDDLSFTAVLKRGRMSYDVAGSTKLGSACECQGYSCACCAHLDVPKIYLNHTGCVGLTYLPNDYGISFTFSLDGQVVYNSTVSARNPPPVCFGVPFLKEYASLCVKFHNLDIQEETFSGCAMIEAELYHVRVAERELGCFHIGPFVSS